MRDNPFNFKSDIPEQTSGDWSIEKFVVSEEDADRFNLHQLLQFTYERSITPGSYTKLVHNGAIVMSDTPAELSDNVAFYYDSHGDVLINGLGLGIIATLVARKGRVDSVTVVEISPDVISMVEPYLDNRIKVIQGDAVTWKPNGARFHCVWHDIWDCIAADNYEEMKFLHRRYGHWLKGDHFQGSWSRYNVERELREEKKNRIWW